MLELLETLITTTSLFNIIGRLAEMSVTDMMVIFLLSKPLFMIIALGAMFSGRKWGQAHYLHVEECDRFLSDPLSLPRTNEDE